MIAKQLSKTETVEEVARGMALDLLEMLRETDGLDSVTITANYAHRFPSVSWLGLNDLGEVFHMHLVGEEEVPRG